MNITGLILRNGNLTKQVSHAILRNTKETGAESPQAKTIFHKLEIFYCCHSVDKRLLLSTCLLQCKNIWSELGKSTLRMFMYYAFMNAIQGRSARETNCNFFWYPMQ